MQRYIQILLIILSVFIFAGQALADISNSGEQAYSSEALESIQVLDQETAQKIAIADNPSLAAARDRVRQAKERVIQARSAYLPRMDASASASRIWLSDKEADVPGSPDSPEDYYGLGLTGTWVLFDGFEREFKNAIARYSEKEFQESEKDARRLLLSSVTNAYFNAQLASENIAIAEADEAFNQQQAKEARIRREVGTGALSDVLNFKVQVNAAKSSLLEAKREYEAAMIGLAALMGVRDAAFPPDLKLAQMKTETSEELAVPEPDPLIAYALEHRPDILMTGYALKQAVSQIDLAMSDFYPDISLSGSFEGNRSNSVVFEGEDFGSKIGLSITYNIFDGGSKRSRLREASAGRDEKEKNYRNMETTVISEVRDSVARLKSARDQLALQRSNADLVQQNRDLVQKGYSAGQESLVRLNEAQRDLIKAKGSLALALVSLRQAWYNLKTSTAENIASFAD
ncbi:MAG: TolC family protein [Desulfobacteraceae bacterium]|nr:TolC family protein [Desulfobacteraceae bacterium]